MILRKDEFSAWVEHRRADTHESFMDTVLEGCEKFNIEIELIAPLLSEQLIGKIKAEAIELKYFKANSKSLKAFM